MTASGSRQRARARSGDGAHAADVPLTLDDFEGIRTRVPVLCDLKPSGRYVATDLHRVGGVPVVMTSPGISVM